MSKSYEELATEIVAAILGSEKGASYLVGTPEAIGTNISTVWTKVYETILDRRTVANRKQP